MKNEYQKLSALILIASLITACGSSNTRHDESGSVAEQKTERAASTAERRIDQHTDHKVNRAVDRLFRKL